jgi:hypothetical protein
MRLKSACRREHIGAIKQFLWMINTLQFLAYFTVSVLLQVHKMSPLREGHVCLSVSLPACKSNLWNYWMDFNETLTSCSPK